MEQTKKTQVQQLSELGTRELKNATEGGSVSAILTKFFTDDAIATKDYKNIINVTHSELVQGVTKALGRTIRPPQVHQYLKTHLDNGFLVRQKGLNSKTNKIAYHYKVSLASWTDLTKPKA